MQQLFIINPAAGKTDASVVLVPQDPGGRCPRRGGRADRGHPQPRPRPPIGRSRRGRTGKKYISMRQAATAR